MCTEHSDANNIGCLSQSTRIRLAVKINDEYKDAKELPAPLLAQQGQVGPARPKEQRKMITAGRTYSFVMKLFVCSI